MIWFDFCGLKNALKLKRTFLRYENYILLYNIIVFQFTKRNAAAVWYARRLTI